LSLLLTPTWVTKAKQKKRKEKLCISSPKTMSTLSDDLTAKDSHCHWRGAVHTGTYPAHTQVPQPEYLFEFRNLEGFYRSRSALEAAR
jgi:hypothetical protein